LALRDDTNVASCNEAEENILPDFFAHFLGSLGKDSGFASARYGRHRKKALALVLAEWVKSRFKDGKIFLKVDDTSPNPLKVASALASSHPCISRLC
jgi:hypothetical protein